jgi:molecular chaperone HscB
MQRPGPHRHTRFLRQAARNREYELIPHRQPVATDSSIASADSKSIAKEIVQTSVAPAYSHSHPQGHAGSNYFLLFNLEQRFALSADQLDNAYRALAARIHPDRFTYADPATQRAAMELSANANEAYRTLKRPVLRAQHLLALHGVATTERSTAMSPAFLMEQMEWRDALNEARSSRDLTALQKLAAQVRQRVQALQAQLEAQLDQQQDHSAAADSVNQMMFTEKLATDIDDACMQLEE